MIIMIKIVKMNLILILKNFTLRKREKLTDALSDYDKNLLDNI